MLLRMYIKYAYKKNWTVNVLNETATSAGIKNALLELPHHAVGLCQSENGVHRLTRVSPFGNGKLQTSFASVMATQSVENKKTPLPRHEIEETFYRGSGPGGQHKNKVETGVRLRHRETGLLVEICTERSQKSNRESAWAVMESRWTDLLKKQADKDQQAAYSKKTGVAFGHQVRTYKLDKSMVIDDRSGKTVSQVKKVLDGDLGLVV